MNAINSSFATTAHAASHAASMTHTDTIQKGLTLASVAVAVISHVPALRFGCALALRTLSLLSASVVVAKQSTDADMLARITNSYKTGVACLGVAAVAISSPALLVATLVSSVAIQTIETLTQLANGAGKGALKQFAGVLIDYYALAVVITSSPTLLVTATVLTTVAMTAIALDTYVHAQSTWDMLEACSYAVLALCAFKETCTALAPTFAPAFAPASPPAPKENNQSYRYPQPEWLKSHNERDKHVIAQVPCGNVEVKFYDDGQVVAKPPMGGAVVVTDGRYDHCNPYKKS